MIIQPMVHKPKYEIIYRYPSGGSMHSGCAYATTIELANEFKKRLQKLGHKNVIIR